MKLHLVCSIESPFGKCPDCNAETALLTGSDRFDVHDEDLPDDHPLADALLDGVETGLEITCHWCPACEHVTAVAVNA